MSRHICSEGLYKAFIQSSSMRYSGLALSEVSPIEISHDSISRWLKDKNFRPSELWSTAKHQINMKEPCLLIADDSVLSKIHSKNIDLVHYQYSGNVHDVIPGIGLVNLVWYGLESKQFIPIDYRVYDIDTDGKTKNTHFREMITLAKSRGICPKAIVMDTWYSSLNNLKTIRSHQWFFVTPVRKNRKVNKNISLEKLEIPDQGISVHLRGYGFVTIFKFVAKNGRIDYVATNMENPTWDAVKTIIKARWSIEVYHRELKQTCGIERCQARSGRAQRNHICMSILAWLKMHCIRIKDGFSFYRQSWDIIKNSIAQSIRCNMAYS